MHRMIDDLLDLTRLESGRPLDLHCAPLDLTMLVREMAEDHQRGARGHRIRVETGAERVTGSWDSGRIERVLSNLLTNAIKYSPDGGEIVIGVDVVADVGGVACAEVTVRDRGMGIPASDLPHIFERFHRGTNVAGRIHGAGIGLAGARQIVQQHGGTLTAESAEGAGSIFTVRLPLLEGEATGESHPAG